MKYIISESQYKILNEELEVDPCFEKSVKFYQSKEGRELLDLMRKQIDGKIKLTKDERKRLRYLVRLTPKC
jgi:cell division septum initiation protein DivIVA